MILSTAPLREGVAHVQTVGVRAHMGMNHILLENYALKGTCRVKYVCSIADPTHRKTFVVGKTIWEQNCESKNTFRIQALSAKEDSKPLY